MATVGPRRRPPTGGHRPMHKSHLYGGTASPVPNPCRKVRTRYYGGGVSPRTCQDARGCPAPVFGVSAEAGRLSPARTPLGTLCSSRKGTSGRTLSFAGGRACTRAPVLASLESWMPVALQLEMMYLGYLFPGWARHLTWPSARRGQETHKLSMRGIICADIERGVEA